MPHWRKRDTSVVRKNERNMKMKNVHYLNQAERELKVAELAERQRDPKFDIELRLL